MQLMNSVLVSCADGDTIQSSPVRVTCFCYLKLNMLQINITILLSLGSIAMFFGRTYYLSTDSMLNLIDITPTLNIIHMFVNVGI
jgi:hypothetical protein